MRLREAFLLFAIASAFAVSLSLSAPAWCADAVPAPNGVAAQNDVTASTEPPFSHEGNYQELRDWVEHAIARQLNALELLRDMALNFSQKGLRIRYSGEDLQQILDQYVLGDDLIMSLLPIEKIESVYIGTESLQPGGKASLMIRLKTESRKKFGPPIGRVEMRMKQYSGINKIDSKCFSELFGFEAASFLGVARVARVLMLEESQIQVKLERVFVEPSMVVPLIKRR